MAENKDDLINLTAEDALKQSALFHKEELLKILNYVNNASKKGKTHINYTIDLDISMIRLLELKGFKCSKIVNHDWTISW